MTSQIEELAGNTVRLTVDVPSHDVHHAVEHAANDLAESVKIPGFRQGKVPRPVLISRVGKDRLYTEAVESHISGWFWNAAARARLRPVAQPEFNFELPANDDAPWQFTATVEVMPKPELPDWAQLEVPYVEPEIPEGLVDHELEVLRSSVAELTPVEGRGAQAGDTVVIDLVSPGGETQHDYFVQLGAGRLVEEVERGVLGMEAGESKEVTFELADESTSNVEVQLKEIKEHVLPPLDDEFVRSASEFDTLAELRADLEQRLLEQVEAEADAAFRSGVVDALVEAAKVQASGPLVESRARELLNGLVRSVESRGIPFEAYLQMTGGSADDLVQRVRAEAAHSVAREVALEAAADKLGITVEDAEVEEVVREQAEAAGEDAGEVILELRERGEFERLREDLRLRNSLDRIAAEVQRIPVELAEARDAIWTPEKEKQATETKLWTPGSKE
jgi:trigger factor